MKFETKLTHKGRNSTKHFGTVNPPIFSSSTIVFPDVESYAKGEDGETFYKPIFDAAITEHAYGIAGNQTSFALQEMMKDLEGGEMSLIAPSGLAAITVVLMAILKSGDHLLMVDSVYGPTRRFCNQYLTQNNIEVTYYDPEIGAGIKDLVKPNTKLIFMESPGSLTFEVQDVDAIVKVAQEKNIFTAIDNSWATPLYYLPLSKGVDISIHALTKYIGGHSDILMGSITTNKKAADIIYTFFRNTGIYTSPHDCYYALRGIRSLAARLHYQKESLKKVIDYLSTVKCVNEILCPAYEKFGGHQLWRKQFTGATPLFSIVLDKEYDLKTLGKMIDNYELFGIGSSWGGFESLARVLRIDRARSVTKGKYKNSVVRYYIGLENVDDIIKDLDAGFKRLVS